MFKKFLMGAALCSVVFGLTAAEVEVVPGVRGNALKFDKSKAGAYSSHYVVPLENGFTVSFWAKGDIFTHTAGLVNNFGSVQIQLRGTHGEIYYWSQLYRKDGENLIWAPGNARLFKNTWRHVALTYDQKGRGVVYCNGKKVAEAQAPADKIVKAQNSVGSKAYFSIGRRFQGSMDEVYLYNRVLTDAEIAALKDGKAPAGAYAAFTMDDPAQPGKDSSGNNRHLSIPAAPAAK